MESLFTLDVSAPSSFLKFDFFETEGINNIDNIRDIITTGSAITVLIIG
jgi:hypothetical protein